MAELIKLALSNFTVTMLATGLLAAGISLLLQPRPLGTVAIAEALLFHFILFSIVFGYLYNAVLHVFFGEMVAQFIGWADSPFQREVGFAILGFAAVGLLATVRKSLDLRLAAILGPSLFLLGAAGGHLQDLYQTGNLAPGNAGSILYTDILLPMLGAALLWLRYRNRRRDDHP